MLGRTIHAYNDKQLPPTETHLTRAEQVSEMTLFCATGVPLIMGGRLPLGSDANSSWTLSLLTNAELLAVHNGSEARRSFVPVAAGEAYGWAAAPSASRGAPGFAYASLFSAADAPAALGARFADLGLPVATQQVCLRDLWAGNWSEPVGAPLPGGGAGFLANVEAHGARAFLLTPVGSAACRSGLARAA